jgi:hypothetical protein
VIVNCVACGTSIYEGGVVTMLPFCQTHQHEFTSLRAERDRLREALLALAWRDGERRCWCLEGFVPFKKEHEPECMAAAAALGLGPGRGENEGER